MVRYGQFCPLAKACEVLCERWTMLVVRELVAGSRRFNEIRRGVPRMSSALLAQRLRLLERHGVVERKADGSGGVAYELTPAGRELEPTVQALGVWGHRWVRSELGRGDLDVGLLMWDMRRSVQPAQLPGRRVVIEFRYPDAPSGLRRWWFVSENGGTDLCLEDPGHEVDVVVTTSVRTMTAVWTRQCGFEQARRDGRVEVLGPPALVRRLGAWLAGSGMSVLGAGVNQPRSRALCAWAWSPSASASVMAREASFFAPSGVQPMTLLRFWNSYTPSGLA
jgi:DNA-binding HxlR family transcriptional regulator